MWAPPRCHTAGQQPSASSGGWAGKAHSALQGWSVGGRELSGICQWQQGAELAPISAGRQASQAGITGRHCGHLLQVDGAPGLGRQPHGRLVLLQPPLHHRLGLLGLLLVGLLLPAKESGCVCRC